MVRGLPARVLAAVRKHRSTLLLPARLRLSRKKSNDVSYNREVQHSGLIGWQLVALGRSFFRICLTVAIPIAVTIAVTIAIAVAVLGIIDLGHDQAKYMCTDAAQALQR